MKPANLLFCSVGLNVALVVAAALLWRQPATPTAASSGQTLRPIEITRVVTNLPAATTFVTNRFHWRQLESTNYDEFVANLRAVSCPERTIRDIVVADVCQAFAASEHCGAPSPFWSNGPRRVAAERQREAELLQLKNDLAAVLRRLFGLEWSPGLKRDVFGEEQTICRVLVGEVSEEQFQRAFGLIMSAAAAKEEVGWRCRDIFLEEDYAELRHRREGIEGKVRAVLSPAQFEEFSARLSVTEWFQLFSSDPWEPLKPGAAELRAIALARSAVWPPGWKSLDLDDAETPPQQEAREAAFDARLREILGPERHAEMKLLEDQGYRSIHSFAQEARLPLATAHTLNDLRKLAVEEVRDLRQDKALDPTVRTQRLEAVAASLTQEVSALLGPRLFGDFLRQSGQWVTNVNRL